MELGRLKDFEVTNFDIIFNIEIRHMQSANGFTKCSFYMNIYFDLEKFKSSWIQIWMPIFPSQYFHPMVKRRKNTDKGGMTTLWIFGRIVVCLHIHEVEDIGTSWLSTYKSDNNEELLNKYTFLYVWILCSKIWNTCILYSTLPWVIRMPLNWGSARWL